MVDAALEAAAADCPNRDIVLSHSGESLPRR